MGKNKSPQNGRTCGQTVGAPDKRCTGLWELHWAFKKGFPRRSESRPSRDVPTTPAVLAPVALPRETQKRGAWGPAREGAVRGPPNTPAVLQMLQRLCGRVQEEVRALRLCPLEPVQDELLYARDLIKDAKNSRAVSPAQHPTHSP